MRQIEFRAWDEQCKEMHYNFQWIDSGTEGNDWIVFKSDRQKLSNKPHPFESPYFRQQYHIMQFTGLLDKNGKKIFEGDVLEIPERFEGDTLIKKFLGVVVFEDYGWLVHNPRSFGADLFDCEYNLNYKLIGNKYENPELLDT